MCLTGRITHSQVGRANTAPEDCGMVLFLQNKNWELSIGKSKKHVQGLFSYYVHNDLGENIYLSIYLSSLVYIYTYI